MTPKINNKFKQGTRSSACNQKMEHKKILKNGLEWNLIMKNFRKQLLHIQINIPKAKYSFKGQIAAKTLKGSTKSRLDEKSDMKK